VSVSELRSRPSRWDPQVVPVGVEIVGAAAERADVEVLVAVGVGGRFGGRSLVTRE
jgi:hypothetical protein